MAVMAKAGLIRGRQRQRIPGQHFGFAWQSYDGERLEAMMKRSVAEISAQKVEAAQRITAVTKALNMVGLGVDE